MTSLAAALTGTWRLERWELVYEDGRAPECPLGEDAEGFLIYTVDGHVSASLARAGRAALELNNDSAKARAFDAYFGYAGRYTVRDGAVIHRIAIAPKPVLTGVETVRHVSLDGDRLTLSGPDFAAASPRSHRIVWRRAAPWASEIVPGWKRFGFHPGTRISLQTLDVEQDARFSSDVAFEVEWFKLKRSCSRAPSATAGSTSCISCRCRRGMDHCGRRRVWGSRWVRSRG